MGNSSIKVTTTYLEEEYYKTIKEQDDVSDLIREHKLRQMQRIKQCDQVGQDGRIYQNGYNLKKKRCSKTAVCAI